VAIVSSGFLFMALCAACAEPPTDPKVLVESLGDNDFDKRQSAESHLKNMGALALPALIAGRNHPDPEIRRRVELIIPALEQSVRLAPRLVNIKEGDFPLKDVLKDLSAQSGYAIETWPNLQDRPVQLKAGRMPVIMALDLIGRQAGCTLQQGFGDDRLRLGQGQPPEHTWFDGAFRVSATNVQQFRNIDLNQAPGTATRRTDSLTLGLNLNGEPRLPLLGVGEPRLSLALDNLDQSLLGPLPGEAGWTGGATRHISRYGNGYRSQSQGFSAPMRRVSERATHIKLVRGSVSCVVLVDQKPVPLTQEILKAKGQTAVVGTTSFTIEEVQETPAKAVTVRLAVKESGKDSGTGSDYTWLNSMYQRLELQDAQGRRFMNQGSSWGNSGPNFAQLTFTFAPPPPGAILPGPGNPNAPKGPVGPPSRLVYTVWDTLEHVVSFEFRDLPLP
jgi:hypothetical protein